MLIFFYLPCIRTITGEMGSCISTLFTYVLECKKTSYVSIQDLTQPLQRIKIWPVSSGSSVDRGHR